MKFVWVQDFDFLNNPQGGAQATDYSHFKYGLKLGYNQLVITPENYQNHPVQGEDILILSNITRFGAERFLDKTNRIIVFHHDYLFCRWRLYFPLADKCFNCFYLPEWKKLYKKAELNIFLSHLHYEMHKKIFGDAIEPYVLVPSPVDPGKFYDMDKERTKDIITVNGHLPFKGRDNLIKFAKENPDRKITVVGAQPDVQLPPNCEYVGFVPNNSLNNILNDYQYYIELPTTPQPFNRSACEAFLAGCKLITNNLLGFTSWRWKSRGEVVKNIGENASKKFWEAIMEVMKDT
jgi:glycosyltransferase involved in cell wall biosynthesis